MRYAEIKDGLVVNIIDCDAEFIGELVKTSQSSFLNVDSTTVGVGDSYDGTGFKSNDTRKPTKRFEVSFDKRSVPKKIVKDMTANTRDGLSYTYVDGGNECLFKSIRGNEIKKYYKPSDGEQISQYIPNIFNPTAFNVFYAESSQGSTVISREWYMAFRTKEELEAMCYSFGYEIPSGDAYEKLKNDDSYGFYSGQPNGYKFFVSIEVTPTETILDLYASLPEDEVAAIEASFQ